MKKHVWMCMLGTVLILAATTVAQAGTPPGRFVDNNDGTVSDSVTSLMWQQQDDGTTRIWEDALAYCEGLTLATYSDWRLPNVKELSGIVDDGVANPAIDTTAFPGTASVYYWSSSSYAYNTSYAWGVYFDNGNVSNVSKTSNYYARCVRP